MQHSKTTLCAELQDLTNGISLSHLGEGDPHTFLEFDPNKGINA